jgi:hypothetical protein
MRLADLATSAWTAAMLVGYVAFPSNAISELVNEPKLIG